MTKKKESLRPEDMKILVVGDRCWGKADTFEEALKNAGKPRYFVAYICHPEGRIDEMGYMCHPHGFPPKKFMRKVPKGAKDDDASQAQGDHVHG